MAVYNSNTEMCATCEHWLGARSLCPNRAEIDVDTNCRGRCRIAKVLSSQGEAATNRCFSWEKWGGFDY